MLQLLVKAQAVFIKSPTNTGKISSIVVHGIAENPQNTNRQFQMKKDLDNVMEALSETGIDIESSDIKDLYCLGKYDSKSERPRPLLVKFLCSSTVVEILSSKSKLEAPIYIKRDLSAQERQREHLLLKERRSLIDNGTEQRCIIIRNNSLYLTTSFTAK